MSEDEKVPPPVPDADDPETAVFRSMIPLEGTKTDPIFHIKALRELIDDLPATRATFRYPEAFASAKGNHRLSTPGGHTGIRLSLRESFVRIAGGWPLPDYMLWGDSTTRYVNPNYEHVHVKPDIDILCECGTRVLHPRRPDAERTYPHDDHGDDCLKHWRVRSHADLLDERRRVAIRALRLGKSVRETSGLLGLKSTSSKWATDLGIDVKAERDCYRRRVANTAAILAREHPVADVADALGRSREWVQRMTKRHTEANLRELYNYRAHGKLVSRASHADRPVAGGDD